MLLVVDLLTLAFFWHTVTVHPSCLGLFVATVPLCLVLLANVESDGAWTYRSAVATGNAAAIVVAAIVSYTALFFRMSRTDIADWGNMLLFMHLCLRTLSPAYHLASRAT
jgi:ABC-type multidrug transport system fused ATPase/permease subunit